MARASFINFQKLNRNLLNGGAANETWTKLTTAEKLNGVKESLEEAGTYVVAAKEYIKSSKDVIQNLQDFIALSQVDIRTAEECIIESERRINCLMSEINSNSKYDYCRNLNNIPVTSSNPNDGPENSNLNITLNKSIPDDILDTIQKSVKHSDLNLENYEAIRYQQYEGVTVIVVGPKKNIQSKSKASSAYESTDSLNICDPDNSECDLDSLNNHASLDSKYSSSDSLKTSERGFEVAKNKCFYSESYKEEMHHSDTPSAKMPNSYRGVYDHIRNFGDLHICDEEGIQYEKSVGIFKEKDFDKRCKCLGNCKHGREYLEKFIEAKQNLIHEYVMEKIKKLSSTDECLVPNVSSVESKNSLNGEKAFIESRSHFLAENEEKLEQLISSINEISFVLKSKETETEKCSNTSDDSVLEIISSSSTSDDSIEYFEKHPEVPTADTHLSNCELIKDENDNEDPETFGNISNAPANCEKPTDATVDKESEIDSEKPSCLSKCDSSDNGKSKLESVSENSADASYLKDCSYITVSVASSDTSTQTDSSNESLNEGTSDTSVHDDSTISRFENYESSVYTSDTSSDSSDTSQTESAGSLSMSLTDCSEDENCSRSIKVYTTDSSLNNLTNSLLSDFTNVSVNHDISILSQNDGLTYSSFKEGVSSASLNNSQESSKEKSSELLVKKCNGMEAELSDAFNIPANIYKSKSPEIKDQCFGYNCLKSSSADFSKQVKYVKLAEISTENIFETVVNSSTELRAPETTDNVNFASEVTKENSNQSMNTENEIVTSKTVEKSIGDNIWSRYFYVMSNDIS